MLEIFGYFGTVRHVDLPTERSKDWIGTGSAYVDFEKAEHAEEARKKMDGGEDICHSLLNFCEKSFVLTQFFPERNRFGFLDLMMNEVTYIRFAK